MKAVVWTDTFQVIIMFVGLFFIIFQGTAKVGGISAVWEKAYQTDRIEFMKYII